MVQLLVARKSWLREQSTATGSDTVLTNVCPLKMVKLELGNTLTILQGVLHQYVRHLDTSYDNETGAQL